MAKKIDSKKIKNNNHKITIIILIATIICTLTILIIKINNNKINNQKEKNCTVIKTYDIKTISPSNNENYKYITISEYQTEGIYTVKISNSISKKIKQNNAYTFTFKTNKEYINAKTDILFNKSEIIKVEYTDKLGMERESTNYCDK